MGALDPRTLIFACQPNLERCDRMTPINFTDESEISPKAMSANLDQDKTGQCVHPGIRYFFTWPLYCCRCYALTETQGITIPEPFQYSLRGGAGSEALRCQQKWK